MSALSIQPTYPIFTDIDGQPLEDGYIWIGVANQAPVVNPITVYWDVALTIPATLPIRTTGGYPINSGTPARLYVNSDYSIQVQNKNGSVVYSAPTATERYSNVVVDVTLANLSFVQSGTGAVTRTALSKMRDAVSPLDFGADPTGVVDATTAIQNAIATGRSIDFGGYQNTFLISSPLTLSAGQCLFGEGATIKTTSNISMVVMANNCQVTGIKFLGNSTGSSQRAIFIDGGASFNAVSRTQVDNCQFKNLGGSAYYVYRIVDAHQGNVFANNTVTGCVVGVDIAERGEYTSVTGNNIDTCGTGIRIIGGNTTVNGGVVSDCTIGLLIGRGANDAHGTVSGVLVNHSTQYAVKFDNPSVNDFRIADCEFYYGDIWCYRSTGMSFANCTFGSNNNFYFQGSIDTYFESCRFITLPTFNNSYNSEPSKTHWVDTQYANLTGGQSAPNINGGYVEVRLATSASIATGVQVVPFDTLSYNALTNDLNYTYQSFWDAGTYTFQNIAALKSPNTNFNCDVTMQLTFGGPGAVDFTKINVYLYEVGTARVVANFTPSVKTYTDGTNNWKVYTLVGRVPKSTYRVVVENDTAGFITAYREQGTNIPFKAVMTGF